MKDFLGREITRGKHIVYPGRRGSSLWVNLGQVLEVTDRSTWNGVVPILKRTRRWRNACIRIPKLAVLIDSKNFKKLSRPPKMNSGNSCAIGPCARSRERGGDGCYLCDTVAKLPQQKVRSSSDIQRNDHKPKVKKGSDAK